MGDNHLSTVTQCVALRWLVCIRIFLRTESWSLVHCCSPSSWNKCLANTPVASACLSFLDHSYPHINVVLSPILQKHCPPHCRLFERAMFPVITSSPPPLSSSQSTRLLFPPRHFLSRSPTSTLSTPTHISWTSCYVTSQQHRPLVSPSSPPPH